MKKAIIRYILSLVTEAIDAYVQSTPSKLDDEVWQEIKKAIESHLIANL